MPQTLTRQMAHIVFSTKHREAFIDSHVEPKLYAYICQIAKSNKGFVYQIGGIEDHIHLLVELPRTIATSTFVGDLKKHSSRWIKTLDAKYEWFAWQRGYGLFSVSPSAKANVIAYIARQKEHHRAMGFQDEFRHMLEGAGLEYDEKYVWD